MAARGGGLPPQHARDLAHAGFVIKEFQRSGGAAIGDVLGDDVVGIRTGGDWGEVRDAEGLAVRADLAHLVADGIRRFTADVGIDLIEDEHRDLVVSGEDGFEGEHHAGHLAGTRDGS